MTTAHKVTSGLAIALAGLLLFVAYSYMKEHEASAVVAAQVKADKAAADAIAAKELENQQHLADGLAGYAKLKQTVTTPAQVVQALPQVVNVPAPIVQMTDAQVKTANAALPDGPKLSEGDLIIPAASVKPFYDAQVDCKAKETKLSSCQLTTSNQSDLIAVKDREIVQLQTALKGGTKWKRTKSTLKFIGVGVAVGAATSAYFLIR
jgi:hypothetical protein